MTNRKPFVGGNWKMNLHGDEAALLAKQLVDSLPSNEKVDIAVFPAFTYLASVGAILKDSAVKLGAQDFYTTENGAYTGEVSLSMLKDVGVSVVLVGHSERRHVLGESNSTCNQKTLAALDAGMEVILCIGEKLEQREAGQTNFVNYGQMALGLAGVTAEQMSKITIAYEPVWAIGTGKTATPQDAQKAHAAIRNFLIFAYGQEVASTVRIQYGGSMKPGNASDLVGQDDIDGGLIGGAALKSSDFTAICEAAVSK
ncbi:MAG: triose-phosphate isomerase [Phycisphaeraceae bacterium]|nr:triose-phosphate isomerase [Phycisphaeraceae bacterium]